MIRAIYRTDGVSHTLVMVGHADYAPNGHDLVCAGASAVVYALLGWLENNEDDAKCVSRSVESGDVCICYKGGEKTRTAFEMAAIGLDQLADNYPDHVSIQITGFAG